ncbi:MAG TPA: hypothetical protein VGP68_23295 [Gemmataceae bacterium]|jgi:hypothetical protein|nr:hypothetical protein [Gemmataceae bacterium]
MVKNAKPSAHGNANLVKSGEKPRQPTSGTPNETFDPELSEAQCQTILKYAKYLPAHLSDRLTAKGAKAKPRSFTLDELDELLDHVEDAIYPAKGNERQKVQRIAERLSKLLGSTIDPDELPRN